MENKERKNVSGYLNSSTFQEFHKSYNLLRINGNFSLSSWWKTRKGNTIQATLTVVLFKNFTKVII